MAMISGAIIILGGAIVYAAQLTQAYDPPPKGIAVILGLVGLFFLVGGATGRFPLHGDKGKSREP